MRTIGSVVLAACLLGVSGTSTIPVPGSPFMALPSSDGANLFVSVQTPGTQRNEIEVYRRDAGKYALLRSVQLDGIPSGLSLTADGTVLLVADGNKYAAVATSSLVRDSSPRIAMLDAGRTSGVIEVAASADGNYAFFSNEFQSTIDVVRLQTNARDGSPQLSFAGSIDVDHAPVGLALSPDGRYLYATSEVGRRGAASCGGRAPGTLSVINVSLAERDARDAVIASVGAGCSPVRVAVSADGKVAWVTVRGAGRLAAFDTSKVLQSSPDALVGAVKVGDDPVGLLVPSNQSTVLVANSNRFDPNSSVSTVSIVDARAFLTGAEAILGTIPAGAFPRELKESPVNHEIYLTNYKSGTVEVIPDALIRK